MFGHAQKATSTNNEIAGFAFRGNDNVLDITHFFIIFVVYGFAYSVLYAPTANHLGWQSVARYALGWCQSLGCWHRGIGLAGSGLTSRWLAARWCRCGLCPCARHHSKRKG